MQVLTYGCFVDAIIGKTPRNLIQIILLKAKSFRHPERWYWGSSMGYPALGEWVQLARLGTCPSSPRRAGNLLRSNTLNSQTTWLVFSSALHYSSQKSLSSYFTSRSSIRVVPIACSSKEEQQPLLFSTPQPGFSNSSIRHPNKVRRS